MSKKNKGMHTGTKPQAVPEVSLQDDPYWKVSRIFSDVHRIGRYLERFDRIAEQHPQWADDILEGIPTYYCVLEVPRGATADEVKAAFLKNNDSPVYPYEVFCEAMEVLSSPPLQARYDEFLMLFEQYTRCLPPFEKNELITRHTTYLIEVKKYKSYSQIQENYGDYCNLYFAGMPDLYEYSGLVRDADSETIQRDCPRESELQKKIYSILNTPALRQEYNLVLDFLVKNANSIGLEERNAKKKLWKQNNREMIEKIILLSLTEPDNIEYSIKRFETLLNTNQDWRQYLPPSHDSFFSILGLDAGKLSADKKEVESVIRDKYRQLDRTPAVNLAYTVLKNKTLREDYLWLFDNYAYVEMLFEILSIKKVKKPIPENLVPMKPDPKKPVPKKPRSKKSAPDDQLPPEFNKFIAMMRKLLR